MDGNRQLGLVDRFRKFFFLLRIFGLLRLLYFCGLDTRLKLILSIWLKNRSILWISPRSHCLITLIIYLSLLLNFHPNSRLLFHLSLCSDLFIIFYRSWIILVIAYLIVFLLRPKLLRKIILSNSRLIINKCLLNTWLFLLYLYTLHSYIYFFLLNTGCNLSILWTTIFFL